MSWEATLAEFRSLGGVANNVRLDYGPRGRGLFAIDPTRPIALHVPHNMLVPTEDIEFRGSRLAFKAGAKVGDSERRFLERYDAEFGTGSPLLDEIWQKQKQWSELPPEVQQFVSSMRGTEDPDRRFAPPSLDLCSHWFLRSRDILYRGTPHCLPLLDLLNHSSTAQDFLIADGITVEGLYESEVLVRYNEGDSWDVMLHYGFPDSSLRAYSLGHITVDLYGRYTLTIMREIARREMHGGFIFPVVEVTGNAIRLSHLTLGNLNGLPLPRAIFRKVMSEALSASEADEVFDSIAYYNRDRFYALLRILNKYDSPLIVALKDAALHQLQAASACVGAQPL